MEESTLGKIQALIPGLGKFNFANGDTVVFADRKPPTVEELEARMAAIRKEIAAHDALGSSGSTTGTGQRSGRRS